MAESRELNLILRLKDEATKELSNIGNKLNDLSPNFKQMALVGTAGLASVSALAIKGVSDFTKFDSAIQKAGANVGATEEVLQKFRDTAISSAKGTALSFDDTSRALSFLAGGSVSADDAMESLADTVKFAWANNLELEKSAVIASQAMTLFGYEGNEVNKVLDVLSKAGQIAFATTDQLSDSFSEVAPLASQLGVSLEDLTAVIGAMGDVGILGSQSGIALKRAFTEILNPSKQMEEGLAMVGLTVGELQSKLKNPIELIKLLEDSFGKIEDPVKRATALSQTFGQVSGPAMSALIGLGTEAIDDYRIALENTEGTTDDIAKRLGDAISPMKIIGDELSELSIKIGQAVLPAIQKMTDILIPVINKVGEWIKENPKLFAGIMIVVGAIFGLLAVIGTLGLAIIGVTGFFTTMIPIIGGVIAILSAFAIPILIAIGVISALIAVGVLLYKNWDTISAKAQEIWGAISGFISDKLNAIKETFSNVFKMISDVVAGAWEVIKQVFTFALAFIAGLVILYFNAMGIDILAVLQTIQMTIQMAWDYIKTIFESTMLIITEWWNTFWDGLSQRLGVAWDFIKNVTGGAWKWMTEIFKKAVEPINEVWGNLWDGMKNVVDASWEVIKSAVKASINYIIDQINKVIEAVNRVAQSGAGALGLDIPSIPTIPRLAKGGIVNKPTIAMIGEAEPEAVVPLKGNNAMGSTINITVNGDISGRDLVEKVKEVLMGDLRADLKFSL